MDTVQPLRVDLSVDLSGVEFPLKRGPLPINPRSISHQYCLERSSDECVLRSIQID
jgi:hypothetical protein